jgi:CBS domain-containing protein
MQARDIMSQPVITVGPDEGVAEIAQILLDNRISAVPVVANGRLVGIVSEGDLLRRHETGTERRRRAWWLRLLSPIDEMAREYIQAHGLRARDVMTTPVVTITEETPVAEIANLLESERIKRVPVVRDGEVVGVVSRANLLHAVAAQARRPAVEEDGDDSRIAEALRERIRAAPWAKPLVLSPTVVDGHVELWGIVRSETQRHALRVLAERTAGVQGVTDHLELWDPRSTQVPATRRRVPRARRVPKVRNRPSS